MNASRFEYGSPTGKRIGTINADLTVATCDGVIIGAIRQNPDTGRWHVKPEPAAWPMQPLVKRAFSSRSTAARWLATTHAAASEGWKEA